MLLDDHTEGWRLTETIFWNPKGRDATPYFEKNRVGRNAIDSTAALTDMGKYLFQERRLPVYDIAVAITKYEFLA